MSALLEGESLKILTLDGGGLQAIATLVILSNICEAIAFKKGTDQVPAPYQLFDIIGGIGTGGWLAILLGRYRLDIARCMSVYMELAKAIDPKFCSCGGRPSKRSDKSFQLEQDMLIAKIEHVLRKHDIDPYLYDREIHENGNDHKFESVRCRHSFAAGVVQGPEAKGRPYQIFRTYLPKSTTAAATDPDPRKLKVSAACAATGAAKFLLKPYKIRSTTFFDAGFPNPHNLSFMALDEAELIYGKRSPVSIVMNIGPGIPSQKDVEHLTELSLSRTSSLMRKFSWPFSNRLRAFSCTTPESKLDLTHVNAQFQGPKRSATVSSSESCSSTASEHERRYGDQIRDRLDRDYGAGARRKYYRFGPQYSGETLALNDVSALDLSNEEVDKFLQKGETMGLVKGAASQYWVNAVG